MKHNAGVLAINGTQLYYEESGSGETVILLHAHSFDLRMWDSQIEALAQHYRVIRYDLRGYGKSAMPDPRRFFRHVDDLAQLIQRLELSKVHLIGLSLGSMVAVDYMALYPEKVLSVSAASSGLYVSEDAQWIPFTEEVQSGNPAPKNDVNITLFKQEWFQGLLGSCGPNRDAIKTELWTMIKEWSAWQPLYERRWPLVGPSLIALLSRNSTGIPLLVLIGEEDSDGSRKSSARLAELMPQAITVYLPQSGHMQNMETPEAFNKVVLSFIHSE
ncbi:alpha/beta fold hydrolase [Paenibacillus sp. Soil522]|uniref:alpha/beta fold hydrolase n=1 Tax=Paenibacillus sp. Soil522 TaxID=1736388 RepID=UPI0006F45778|nr:alpha/beta hydrolase [Paenibacillus sp. Soil522]KRE38764.1 hypothetical protein ASG81_19760 [Paenibacillus sp. Soil522]